MNCSRREARSSPERDRSSRQVKRSELKRKSGVALGVGVICGVFLLEMSLAHRTMPSPLSHYVWAGLGAVGVFALMLSVDWRRKANSVAGCRGTRAAGAAS